MNVSNKSSKTWPMFPGYILQVFLVSLLIQSGQKCIVLARRPQSVFWISNFYQWMPDDKTAQNFKLKPGPLALEPCIAVKNLKPESSNWAAIPPPSGGVGDFCFFLAGLAIISLLAGHVGNIEGSTGRGASLNQGCERDAAAVIRLEGS